MLLASVMLSRVALDGGSWRVHFPKSNKKQNRAADNCDSVRLPHNTLHSQCASQKRGVLEHYLHSNVAS